MFSKLLLASLAMGSALAVPTKTSPDFPQPAVAEAEVNKVELHPLLTRATGEWVNSPLANWNSGNIQDGVGNGVDRYVTYLGDGTTSQGWPAQSQWVSFENMFNNYKAQMSSSCSAWGQAGDSGPEIGAIWDGIQMAAAASGVDHRFILAVIMQESGGCVRVITSNGGVRNPGLMQDHNGAATCNENGVKNPCPSATIYQMISEGVQGTTSGDGLANCINQSGRSDVSGFYRAARIYNSGSVSSTGALQNGIATHCYASDIANRLTGWVNAAHGCTCDQGGCGVVTH
ncbi:hypothetical protein ESCO_001554 [Escovopsis weberi]|uniref:Transglycosylase SLT domain-containing protein n=1 Tax=Escovopsis weberi TaxID=150374 RepID=A0A0M8N8M7_ESCWE|nr:hypothetical protein ESCO_001554 [Escovopsis weberi]